MNWMTVKELAKYLKLSEMMIYKLAQGGELPAAKVGSAWRFSQSAVDDWLMKQTREKLPFSPLIQEVIDDFVAELKKKYADNLSTVIVFGSHARGDADEDSDVDVLVVLKDSDEFSKLESEIVDLSYEVTYGRDRCVLMAPIVMRESKFLTGMSPLLLNVRREGVRAA